MKTVGFEVATGFLITKGFCRCNWNPTESPVKFQYAFTCWSSQNTRRPSQKESADAQPAANQKNSCNHFTKDSEIMHNPICSEGRRHGYAIHTCKKKLEHSRAWKTYIVTATSYLQGRKEILWYSYSTTTITTDHQVKVYWLKTYFIPSISSSTENAKLTFAWSFLVSSCFWNNWEIRHDSILSQ